MILFQNLRPSLTVGASPLPQQHDLSPLFKCQIAPNLALLCPTDMPSQFKKFADSVSGAFTQAFPIVLLVLSSVLKHAVSVSLFPLRVLCSYLLSVPLAVGLFIKTNVLSIRRNPRSVLSTEAILVGLLAPTILYREPLSVRLVPNSLAFSVLRRISQVVGLGRSRLAGLKALSLTALAANSVSWGRSVLGTPCTRRFHGASSIP